MITYFPDLSSSLLEWHVGIEPTYTRFAVCRLTSQPVPRGGLRFCSHQSSTPKKNPYMSAVCIMVCGPKIIASAHIIIGPNRYLALTTVWICQLRLGVAYSTPLVKFIGFRFLATLCILHCVIPTTAILTF